MTNIQKIIGSGFTCGYLIPKAPGTEGSLVAALTGAMVYWFIGATALHVFLLVSLVAAYWTAPGFIKSYGNDPKFFVMDEWVGQIIALHSLLLLPHDNTHESYVATIVISFVLFRFFDIIKPLGIRKVEKLPGSHGVIWDDIIAGIYTFLTLFFVILAVL